MSNLLENKALCKVRTVTTFVTLSPHQALWKEEIIEASAVCATLSKQLQQHGYHVQSNRIVTNPFGEYLNTESLESAREGLRYLSNLLNTSEISDIRIRFAIGEAKTAHEISLIPALIQEFGDLCNVCVNVGLDEHGILDNRLMTHAAEAVKKISEITPRGEGNFNFTVNFNCAPWIPYFPASYHKKELKNCFVIGLETPDLLVAVLEELNQHSAIPPHNERYHAYYTVMREALQHHISAIDTIVTHTALPADFMFAGFDSSAAPSKSCASMTAVYEQMGVDYFGASGTVEASALLTRVFKSIQGVQLTGFSGLMLALTEDTGLAEGTLKDHFDIRALLTYSAVCGIGLDTVPIPGDTSINKISALMRDTGTMAFRLNKPLTVRLFPVPGLSAGELTQFESDDLCNCAVLTVP
ncbi:DUF711 family protein [Amphritea sp. 1_MG-2023]|uniref:DUF711 family protein n=1 Tax=Amphritea sp. 1_MG-2023 TaxID=3062670 RepID=UPI0026E2CEEA|nr:DUF711 family protein [Amphritea sp. 1_MG-2023]MDO6561957.1 DUF711 family protein [Amphritea sp. 1_MG-2023]